MRISDWSSDVCSSDLVIIGPSLFDGGEGIPPLICSIDRQISEISPASPFGSDFIAMVSDRSEERRVGKECVSTCRSRWSPDHSKKKQGTQIYIHVTTTMHQARRL